MQDNVPQGTDGPGNEQDFPVRVFDKKSQPKKAAENFRRSAVETVEAQREPVAATLDQAAAAIHEKADELPRKAAAVVHGATNNLEKAADYIRTHDTNAMLEDGRGLIRRYPAQTLAAAAILGFFIGSAFRRKSA